MPRQQTQRLNKRPSVDTQLGKLGTGRTEVVSMPTVTPAKTSGAKLAEAFGMVVESGQRIMQMDKANRKEKSQIRVQEEKLQWIDTLNNLQTAEERAQWVESKIHEVSNPEVDEHYRNAAIGALTPFYSKYIPEAKKEYNLGLQGKSTNVVVSMLEEGTFSIESLQETPSFKAMDNAYKHTAITNGITAHYTNSINNATTVEEVQTLQQDLNRTLASYNKSTFYGGSAAKSALNLKSKMTKAVTSAIASKTTALGTAATDRINLMKEQNSSFTDVETEIDNHPTWSKDKKETEKLKYKPKWEAFQKTEDFKNRFQLLSSSNNVNYNQWGEKEKEHARENATMNLDWALNNGAYTSFADNAVKNEYIGKSYVKDLFNMNTVDSETVGKNLTLYRELRNVEHGQKVLSYLDPDTRAFYSILSTNPKFDPDVVRQQINETKGLGIVWKQPNESKLVANNNRNDWLKATSDLPQRKKNAAERMLTIYSQTMDTDTAIEKVKEDYINLDMQEAEGGMKITGYSGGNPNYIEDGLKNYIFKDSTIDTDNLKVDIDQGVMTVYDTENPFIPAMQLPFSDFIKAVATLKAQEVVARETDNEFKRAGGVTTGEVKAFTNSMKHPYYDDFEQSLIGKVVSGTYDFTDIKIAEDSWLSNIIDNVRKVKNDPLKETMTTTGAGLMLSSGNTPETYKARRKTKSLLAPKLSERSFDILTDILAISIGAQETNNKNIVQDGGGPGRGFYQYELTQGGSGAAQTAINRYNSIFGTPMSNKGEDFTKYTREEQTLMMLADKAKTKGTTKSIMAIKNAKTLDEAKNKLADFWADHHKKIKVHNKEKVRFKKNISGELEMLLQRFIQEK